MRSGMWDKMERFNFLRFKKAFQRNRKSVCPQTYLYYTCFLLKIKRNLPYKPKRHEKIWNGQKNV